MLLLRSSEQEKKKTLNNNPTTTQLAHEINSCTILSWIVSLQPNGSFERENSEKKNAQLAARLPLKATLIWTNHVHVHEKGETKVKSSRFPLVLVVESSWKQNSFKCASTYGRLNDCPFRVIVSIATLIIIINHFKAGLSVACVVQLISLAALRVKKRTRWACSKA